MAAYSTLYDQLRVRVPRAPNPLMLQGIRDAIIELCGNAPLLVDRNFAAINVVADQSTYTLTPPADRDFVYIKSAQFDGYPLIATSEDEIDLVWREGNTASPVYALYHRHAGFGGADPGWRTLTQSRPQAYFLPEGGNQIRLFGIPDASLTGGLTVQPVLKPSRTATEVDDWVMDDYYLAIREGALAFLYEIPDRGWSNVNRAIRHRNKFEKLVSEARAQALRSHIRDDQTVRRTTAYL